MKTDEEMIAEMDPDFRKYYQKLIYVHKEMRINIEQCGKPFNPSAYRQSLFGRSNISGDKSLSKEEAQAMVKDMENNYMVFKLEI